MRFVISLTTSPLRLPNIVPTILTMANQEPKPEAIILNLPALYKNNLAYPEIPEELASLVRINVIPTDLGPLTKLAPTIDLYEPDEDINIVTIDDDILYMPHTLELYARMRPLFKKPTAMGLSGFIFNGTTIVPQFTITNCHVIEGYGSICYHRSMFEPKATWLSYVKVCLDNRDLYLSDDLIISNWLGLQNISRFQVQAPWVNRKLMWETGCILELGKGSDALHNTAGGNSERYKRAIKYLAKIKLLTKKEYT